MTPTDATIRQILTDTKVRSNSDVPRGWSNHAAAITKTNATIITIIHALALLIASRSASRGVRTQ